MGPPAEGAEPSVVQLGDVGPVEFDPAFGGFQQPQNQVADGGFPRARFPRQSARFPRRQPPDPPRPPPGETGRTGRGIRRPREKPLVNPQHFAHLVAHGEDRVEGSHGLLKNHGDPPDRRISFSERENKSIPSNPISPPPIRPDGWEIIRITARAVADFPRPDSPTRPGISLLRTASPTSDKRCAGPCQVSKARERWAMARRRSSSFSLEKCFLHPFIFPASILDKRPWTLENLERYGCPIKLESISVPNLKGSE